MVRRDGAEVRKARIQEIARLIQRELYNHGEISLFKTVKTFAYNFGLTEQRIMEYVEIIECLGQFTLDKEHNSIKRVSEDK
jgi:hypothetical protein